MPRFVRVVSKPAHRGRLHLAPEPAGRFLRGLTVRWGSRLNRGRSGSRCFGGFPGEPLPAAPHQGWTPMIHESPQALRLAAHEVVATSGWTGPRAAAWPTADEVHAAVAQGANGRGALVTRFAPYVAAQAQRYAGAGLEVADLAQVGLMAVDRALCQYDGLGIPAPWVFLCREARCVYGGGGDGRDSVAGVP